MNVLLLGIGLREMFFRDTIEKKNIQIFAQCVTMKNRKL